jgi:hypothetical protein
MLKSDWCTILHCAMVSVWVVFICFGCSNSILHIRYAGGVLQAETGVYGPNEVRAVTSRGLQATFMPDL